MSQIRNVAGLPYGWRAFLSTVPPMTSRPGPIAGADVHMQGMGVVQSPPEHAFGD
jgi:hypothetical protein